MELRRERDQQVARLEHVLHRVVDVALVHHGGVGVELILATCERAGGHVVLEDLNGVHVLEVHARHLIKGDAVPVAHQAHTLHGARAAACVHATEQVCRGGLATGKQNRIRRDLLVHMTLARTARSKLAQVEVALRERDEAGDVMELLLGRERAGFIAAATQDEGPSTRQW